MRVLKILSPIKSVKDMVLIEKTGCRSVYACHSIFFDCHNEILEYIKEAKEHGFEFFINFASNVNEDEIRKIKDLLQFLITCPIDGILINNLAVLELIKSQKLPFKVVIDSGLDIHNLSGIEFVNLFHQVDNINITEEIYLKNLIKIKKYTKYKLSIDSDNLPWIAEDVLKNKAIEMVVIKGEFETSKDLVQGIQLIDRIIENPKIFKNQKLPFKHLKDSFYKSNHFSGEFLSAEGKDFKFRGNIQKFEWKYKRSKIAHSFQNCKAKIPRLNLRLTSLEQVKYLVKYIKSTGINPVYSVEYGEIVNTADLAKNNFNLILEKVKKDCLNYGIKLQLSTPRILIERDFDRVYEYVKLLCINEPYPSSIIVNNLGFWWAIINDGELGRMPIELGHGLNLSNSVSVLCLANQHRISSIDLSNFSSIKDIELCIKELRNVIPTRKLTIAGSIRVPSLGLCPLNNDSAILSRLSCAAPCHHGNYAVCDPSTEKLFPIAVDGFCRMHLFRDQVLDLFKYIKYFQDIGINEFVVDFNGLSAKLVPVLLNRFLSALNSSEYESDPNFIENLYEINSDLTISL